MDGATARVGRPSTVLKSSGRRRPARAPLAAAATLAGRQQQLTHHYSWHTTGPELRDQCSRPYAAAPGLAAPAEPLDDQVAAATLEVAAAPTDQPLAAPAPPAPPASASRTVLVAACVAALLAAVHRAAFSVLAIPLQQQLGLSMAQMGALHSALLVGYLLAQVLFRGREGESRAALQSQAASSLKGGRRACPLGASVFRCNTKQQCANSQAAAPRLPGYIALHITFKVYAARTGLSATSA